MPLRHLLLIAVGGAVGTSVRWLTTDLSAAEHHVTAILILNVIGSALVGLMAGAGFGPGTVRSNLVWPLVAIGFSGGLTTYATFAVQVASRLDTDRTTAGLSLSFVTVVATLFAAGTAFSFGRSRFP